MIGIVFDFHDTLVESTKAWLNAFKKVVHCRKNFLQIKKDYLNKVSRKLICQNYGIDYNLVLKYYREYLKIKKEGMHLYENLALKYPKIPFILVSNASKERLMLDINKFKEYNFDKIYSKENGQKPNKEYFEKICKENNIDFIILIGNDEKEDCKVIDNMLSFMISKKKKCLLFEIEKVIKNLNSK